MPAPNNPVAAEPISNDGSLGSIQQPPVPPANSNPTSAPEPEVIPTPDNSELGKGELLDPNASPAEGEEGDEVSIADFELAKTSRSVPDKKKLAVKDETVDPVKPVVDATKQTTPAVDKTKYPDKRDYSRIPEPLRAHFKSMSNDSFATLEPLVVKQHADLAAANETIKKLQEGKEIIPESYHEHELAYMLTPDFKQAALEENEANTVFQHWTNQLNAVREGAKEYVTLARDPNTGQLTYGAKVPADASAETKLMALFNGAQNQFMQMQAKRATVQEGYKVQHAQTKTWLSQKDTEWFSPVFKDPKNPMAIATEQFMNNFPATFRSNPLARFVAQAMVGTMTLARLLAQEQAKNSGAPIKGAPAAKPAARQPTESDLGNEGGDGGKDNELGNSIDDFKARMNGHLVI